MARVVYVVGISVVVAGVLLAGARLMRLTSGESSQTRSVLPVGPGAKPGDNPVVQAMGGGIAQPVATLAPGEQASPPTVPVDGFDAGAADWTPAANGALSEISRVTEPNGATRLHWRYAVRHGEWAIMGRTFSTPQDWRSTDALELTVEGRGTGNQITVLIATRSHAGSDDVDRYEASFVDSSKGVWSEVIPWSDFGRTAANGKRIWTGSIPLDQVAGLALIVKDPGPGTLDVKQVAVQPRVG